MRLLGIDYGKSKVGLALGDDITKMAFGFKTIKNQGLEKLIKEMKKIIEEEDIDLVVVGKPLNMQGKEEIPKDLREFFNELKALNSVVWQDERLTTKQAEAMAKTIPGKPIKFKELDDKLAAMVILQSYLDSL
jgi:putative Holliday junction resolvase